MLLEELQKNIDKQQDVEYKIYCDLDGVLANFIKGVKSLVSEYSDAEYENNAGYRKKMWSAIDKYSKSGGKLWAELDKTPDADILWNYIKKYDPEILTATGYEKYGAGEQKREWFPKNFGPGTKINLVQQSKEKAKFAAPNHILIDDMSKSINPWIEAGGIGILHTSANNTITELKKLGL